MLRVFTDFNAAQDDGACWILVHEGENLDEDRLQALGLTKGSKILLDPEEDFVVVGTLDHKFVRALGRDVWVAYPDWSTRTEKENSRLLRR